MFALIISHDCRAFGGVCPDMNNDDEERNTELEKYASQARQLCSASHAHATAKAPINQTATPLRLSYAGKLHLPRTAAIENESKGSLGSTKKGQMVGEGEGLRWYSLHLKLADCERSNGACCSHS